MTIFTILLALFVDQVRDFSLRRVAVLWLARYANRLEHWLNAGLRDQGMLAWGLLVAVPTALTLAVSSFLAWLHPFLAWLFGAVVLYLSLSFRSLNEIVRGVLEALKQGKGSEAESVLASWQGRVPTGRDEAEVARLTVEELLRQSYRNLFAFLFWFGLLGAPGVILYRTATVAMARWGAGGGGSFGEFSRWAMALLDWVPARLTALSFAVVGNFEDAIYCWRNQGLSWSNREEGILLAAGAGALRIRLVEESTDWGSRCDLGLGEEADAGAIQASLALVWRSVLVWVGVLLIFTIGGWVAG